MYTTGQDIQQISTDGIDYLFERINHPEICYGYTYLQSGHLFYIITFYDPSDNLTLAYDFKTGQFYNLSDENGNYFIAKKTVFFDNKYYFISINDGDIYEINSEFTNYEYIGDRIQEIPRMVTLPTYRPEDGVPQIFNDLWFVLEQGVDADYTGVGNNIASITVINGGSDYTEAEVVIEGDGTGAHATATIVAGVITAVALDNGDGGIGYTWAVVTIVGDGTAANCQAVMNVAEYMPRVDLAVSYDGAYSWSNFAQMPMNTFAKYRNRFYYNDLGSSNEFTPQFRIWCKTRFVCKNGMMSFYR